MRILSIAPTGFFADYGCHVRIRGQMAALAGRGHAIRIVTYPTGREVDHLSTSRPLFWPRRREMPVGSSRRKLALDALLAPTALAAALRFPGGPPELIHAYLHEGALLGAALARLMAIPLVFDFQGSLTSEMLDHRFIESGSPFLPALHRLERWIDHQPQAILASSHHAAGLLSGRFGVPAQRIHALPDSVDPRAFRPRHELPRSQLDGLRRRLGLPTGRPILVYLGLLAPYQGTELLLEAVRLLARRQAIHCLVMGFPNVDLYRQRAVALGLKEHVTFTGAVPYEVAPLYLALGDVALAPKLSATEGSGKLLNYMAAALPVVASDTPVHREYLADLGYFAAPGSAQGLADGIEQALADPQEAGRRGWLLRGQAIERHTWEHAAAQIEAVYRELTSLRWLGSCPFSVL